MPFSIFVPDNTKSSFYYQQNVRGCTDCCRSRGATVARLTPDQKVACSNHVAVIHYHFLPILESILATADSWQPEDLFRYRGSRGATVARLTPDQKVACSNHVAVIHHLFSCYCCFSPCLTVYFLSISDRVVDYDNEHNPNISVDRVAQR
jgi:hypothetical protein